MLAGIMQEPKVSIVLMSYNQPALLEKAFNSLINQTYSNIEIIIADDCSADVGNRKFIEKVVADFPGKVKAVFQPEHAGIPKNKNAGFRLATGDYITYLDGDDTYYENKIASEIATFNNNPDAGVVYSNFDIKNMQDEVLFVWASQPPAQGYIFRNIVLHQFPGCYTHRYEMFKKEVLYDLNFYDESFPVYEDLDMMIRYSMKYKVAYNNYVASSYHTNPSSVVSNTKGLDLLECQLNVYRKHFGEIKKRGLMKPFKKYYNNLTLNKLYYLEKPDIAILGKAFLHHPFRIVKFARILNFLIKKPKPINSITF